MHRVIDLNQYKLKSLSYQLKNFYRTLDKASVPADADREVRLNFIKNSFGRFLSIYRGYNQVSHEELALSLGIPVKTIKDLESGEVALSEFFLLEFTFFRVCRSLGAGDELFRFIAKLRLCLNFGARKSKILASEDFQKILPFHQTDL